MDATSKRLEGAGATFQQQMAAFRALRTCKSWRSPKLLTVLMCLPLPSPSPPDLLKASDACVRYGLKELAGLAVKGPALRGGAATGEAGAGAAEGDAGPSSAIPNKQTQLDLQRLEWPVSALCVHLGCHVHSVHVKTLIGEVLALKVNRNGGVVR